MSFPCAITFPKPGGGWKEGETIIALYAYRLRGGHWRMDCCVQGRVPAAAGSVAADGGEGMRGQGGGAHELWLAPKAHAGKRAVAPAFGGGGGSGERGCGGGGAEEGDDTSSMPSSKSGGSEGKGRPRKAPKLPAKSDGQPSAAKPLPTEHAAAHVDTWVAAQAGVMPEWQKRAGALEGEVLLLRGKLQQAEQRAAEAERRATAAERERDHLGAQARKPNPKARAQGQQQEEATARGGGGRAWGGGVGTKYLMAGSQPRKSEAEMVKGELSAVASTARLLLHQREGRTFESVVPGHQATLDNHEVVERRYPGDALVQAAINLAFEPPPTPRSPWVRDVHRQCEPVVSPCERPF